MLICDLIERSVGGFDGLGGLIYVYTYLGWVFCDLMLVDWAE